MTLNEAKVLLSENNINFDVREYENEAAYCHHSALFPYTKNAKNCKVIALVITSNNNHKNIELQFIDENNDGNYTFVDLYFGEYFFELFDCEEEFLQQSITDEIKSVISNEVIVIVANNLKRKSRLGDACFDLNVNDDYWFGKAGFERAMQRIQKPKGIISKLLKSSKQYEIYDWNSYQCIIK